MPLLDDSSGRSSQTFRMTLRSCERPLRDVVERAERSCLEEGDRVPDRLEELRGAGPRTLIPLDALVRFGLVARVSADAVPRRSIVTVVAHRQR